MAESEESVDWVNDWVRPSPKKWKVFWDVPGMQWLVPDKICKEGQPGNQLQGHRPTRLVMHMRSKDYSFWSDHTEELKT